MPAWAAKSGVLKSGSPTLRSMMSRPSARSSRQSVATAIVAEGWSVLTLGLRRMRFIVGGEASGPYAGRSDSRQARTLARAIHRGYLPHPDGAPRRVTYLYDER